jgi:hypothetical protein
MGSGMSTCVGDTEAEISYMQGTRDTGPMAKPSGKPGTASVATAPA